MESPALSQPPLPALPHPPYPPSTLPLPRQEPMQTGLPEHVAISLSEQPDLSPDLARSPHLCALYSASHPSSTRQIPALSPIPHGPLPSGTPAAQTCVPAFNTPQRDWFQDWAAISKSKPSGQRLRPLRTISIYQ